MITDKQKISKLLKGKIEKIYPSEQKLREVLMSGKRLTVYHGIDPTASSLHLGHSASLFLLREFQELGHKTILLIGDFTARIGDPTGKDKTRKSLTEKEILNNCKAYKKQASRFLEFGSKENSCSLKFNSQWLEKLNLQDIINLFSKFTVQRMIERDMFQKRLTAGKPIWLSEFIYPLLQGYDSVAMNVDIEIGGSDQLFNMLVGRELMKDYKKKEKFVITVPLLVEKRTGKKMSKSEGNTIVFSDPPNEMYGKVMAQPDENIKVIINSGTAVTTKEKQEIYKLPPRDQKARTAQEVVSVHYGKEKARRAKEEFEKVFKKKKLPSKILEVTIKEKELRILDLLFKTKLVSSKSEAKRAILQKGVKIDSQIQSDWQKLVKIRKGMIVQIGKRKFAKIT